MEFIFESFDFTSKIYFFIIKILQDINSNIPLKVSAMNIIPFLLKYGKRAEKEDLIKFLDKEILFNKSFYNRRLYLTFLEHAIKNFSFFSLVYFQIVENFVKLLQDNNIIISKVLSLLKNVIPFIYLDSKLKYILLDKIDILRKINTNDYEVNRVENFILFFLRL